MRPIKLTDYGTGETVHINADHIAQVRAAALTSGQTGALIITTAVSLSEGNWRTPVLKEPPDQVINLIQGRP